MQCAACTRSLRRAEPGLVYISTTRIIMRLLRKNSQWFVLSWIGTSILRTRPIKSRPSVHSRCAPEDIDAKLSEVLSIVTIPLRENDWSLRHNNHDSRVMDECNSIGVVEGWSGETRNQTSWNRLVYWMVNRKIWKTMIVGMYRSSLWVTVFPMCCWRKPVLFVRYRHGRACEYYKPPPWTSRRAKKG